MSDPLDPRTGAPGAAPRASHRPSSAGHPGGPALDPLEDLLVGYVRATEISPAPDLAARIHARIAADPARTPPRRFVAAVWALDAGRALGAFRQTLGSALGHGRFPALVRVQAMGLVLLTLLVVGAGVVIGAMGVSTLLRGPQPAPVVIAPSPSPWSGPTTPVPTVSPDTTPSPGIITPSPTPLPSQPDQPPVPSPTSPVPETSRTRRPTLGPEGTPGPGVTPRPTRQPTPEPLDTPRPTRSPRPPATPEPAETPEAGDPSDAGDAGDDARSGDEGWSGGLIAIDPVLLSDRA